MDRTRELLRQPRRGQGGQSGAGGGNAGLVWSVARRFLGRGYELEDLFQIGNIGLLKCIDKFDLSLEVRFSTYAVPMILGDQAILRDDGLLKVSRPLKETATKARYLRQSLTQKNGVEPTVRELARPWASHWKTWCCHWKPVGRWNPSRPRSSRGTGRPCLCWIGSRAGRRRRAGGSDPAAGDHRALPPKERRLIVLRYFQDKTQAQVAAELGISQVQVSRLEKKILTGSGNNSANKKGPRAFFYSFVPQ